MDTPPRPPHATPPGQPARAHNVRGRPPVPSGSPAGGGPCGDPDVGAACGALGRARPRLVPLGSQCSVGGREPRPESCGGAAGQPAVPMRGRGVRGQGPDVSGQGLASQQPWGSQGPGRQEAAGGETVVIAEAGCRGWAVAMLPRRADARGRGCRLDARCPHWAPPWGRRRRILLELSGQGGRARGPWAPDTSACLGLGSRSRRARAAGTGRPLLTRGSPGVPDPRHSEARPCRRWRGCPRSSQPTVLPAPALLQTSPPCVCGPRGTRRWTWTRRWRPGSWLWKPSTRLNSRCFRRRLRRKSIS